MFGALHAPVPPPDGALLALAREFTPRSESLGPAEVLLDLHGLGRVWRLAAGPGRSAARRRSRARMGDAARGPGLDARGRPGGGTRPRGADRHPGRAGGGHPRPAPARSPRPRRRPARAVPEVGPAHARRPGRAARARPGRAPRRRRARGCAASAAARTRRRWSRRARRRRSSPRSSWNGPSTAWSRSRSCSRACWSRSARISRSAGAARRESSWTSASWTDGGTGARCGRPPPPPRRAPGAR